MGGDQTRQPATLIALSQGNRMGQYDHLERDAPVRLLERRNKAEFLMLHKHNDRLDSDGPFALERMRWE